MNIQTEQQARQRLKDIVINVKTGLSLHHPPSYLGVSDPVATHLGLKVYEAELDLDEGQYYPDEKLIVLDPRVRSRSSQFYFFP